MTCGREGAACGERLGARPTGAAANGLPDNLDERLGRLAWAPRQAVSGFVALPSSVAKAGAGPHCIGEDEHLAGFA
jgi:hypothetical protein